MHNLCVLQGYVCMYLSSPLIQTTVVGVAPAHRHTHTHTVPVHCTLKHCPKDGLKEEGGRNTAAHKRGLHHDPTQNPR